MDAFCCWQRWWWELRRKRDEFIVHAVIYVCSILPMHRITVPLGTWYGSNFILANKKWGGLAYKAETLKVHCYHRQWEIKKGLLLSTIVLNQGNCARSSSNISAFHSETCFIIMILVPGGALSWGTHAAGRVPGIFRIVTHTCLVLHLQLEREQDLVKLPVLRSNPDRLGEVPESRVQPSGSMEGLGSGVEDSIRSIPKG